MANGLQWLLATAHSWFQKPDLKPFLLAFQEEMKTTSLIAQGYLCSIYLLDANTYLLDVKTCESLTAETHAQFWRGNVGITYSAGQSWRTHFHCHTRIWGWPQFFNFPMENTCPSFTKVFPPWISRGTKALWCLWPCSDSGAVLGVLISCEPLLLSVHLPTPLAQQKPPQSLGLHLR